MRYSKNINLSIFRNRHRTARRISREIDSLSKTRNQSGRQKREKAYSKLIEIAKASWKQAQKVKLVIGDSNLLEYHHFLQRFEIFLPRVLQVIEQTQRRIFNCEKVPATSKIVSIFESHTDIIC